MSDRGDEPRDGDAAGELVGSIAEEAAKLFGALSGWAREHGDDVGEGFSGVAAHAADAVREVNDHVANGAPECKYCPVCRTIHVVRSTSPEVRAHLSVAAASLMQAAAGMLATAAADTSGAPQRGKGVEHIDLDETDSDGDWPGEED